MAKQTFTQEFERVVLASLIQDQKFMKEALSVLRPDYFINETHKSAAKVIAATYVRTKGPPSKVGMLSALVSEESSRYRAKKADEDKLVVEPCRQLVDSLFSPINGAKDVKLQFLDFCKQREFESILNEALVKVENGEIDPPAAMEMIRKTDKRINCLKPDGSNFFLDLGTFKDRIKDLRKRKITTGFPSFDKILHGGYSVDSVTTWIAPSKGGKSMVLVHTGYHALHMAYNVVHFTLEITQPWIELRYASRITGIPMDESYDKLDSMANLCAEYYFKHNCQLFVKGYPPRTATVNDFRSYLYSLDSEFGVKPHLIIVDYGDLVKATSNKLEERHALADVWTELRALAQEFNCAMVTATQTNRAGFDKTVIRMSDIAEAIQKVWISDNILSICKTEDEDREGKARLFFAGSRESRSGQIIPIRFDWRTCFMAESNDKVNLEIFK